MSRHSFAQRLERAGSLLARIILFLGAAVMFSMLVLTCVDVFGRYILNAPVNGKTEITRLMMAVLIFCALPVASAKGEQITVDLLDGLFRKRLAVVRDIFVDLISAGCLFVMVDWLLFRSERLYKRGYVTDFLDLPLYPIAYFISFMTFLTGLAIVGKLVVDILRLKDGDPGSADDASLQDTFH